MENQTSYQLDQAATISKILSGDMPDGVVPEDSIILVSDDVLRIYTNILSGLLFSTIPEEAPDEMSIGRMTIFDAALDVVNKYRCGRLYRLIEGMSEAMKDLQTETKIWPNTKMRNNVFSYICDFWIWDQQQKNQVLVITEVETISPEVEFEQVDMELQ